LSKYLYTYCFLLLKHKSHISIQILDIYEIMFLSIILLVDVTMIERQSYFIYCLCLMILIVNFVHVQSDMFNNDDLGTLVEQSDQMLMKQVMSLMMDASGTTSRNTVFFFHSY